MSTTQLECLSCGKRAVLVELTAEDIQRAKPPLIRVVCVECREKYRSAARLETRYPASSAIRDLVLLTVIAFSLLILLSNVISGWRVSSNFGAPQVFFFVTAATSLTGLKMAYSFLGSRYGFTHDLAWSLHSRYAMLSISLIIAGILASAFHILLA